MALYIKVNENLNDRIENIIFEVDMLIRLKHEWSSVSPKKSKINAYYATLSGTVFPIITSMLPDNSQSDECKMKKMIDIYNNDLDGINIIVYSNMTDPITYSNIRDLCNVKLGIILNLIDHLAPAVNIQDDLSDTDKLLLGDDIKIAFIAGYGICLISETPTNTYMTHQKIDEDLFVKVRNKIIDKSLIIATIEKGETVTDIINDLKKAISTLNSIISDNICNEPNILLDDTREKINSLISKLEAKI